MDTDTPTVLKAHIWDSEAPGFITPTETHRTSNKTHLKASSWIPFCFGCFTSTVIKSPFWAALCVKLFQVLKCFLRSQEKKKMIRAKKLKPRLCTGFKHWTPYWASSKNCHVCLPGYHWVRGGAHPGQVGLQVGLTLGWYWPYFSCQLGLESGFWFWTCLKL